MAGRPYFYYATESFTRSQQLSIGVARKVLHDEGFKIGNTVKWEQFGDNADTLVLVTSVPLSASKTYVSVIASSNNQASAQMWAPRIMQAIEKSKMVTID
jgi:hypothetical protein